MRMDWEVVNSNLVPPNNCSKQAFPSYINDTLTIKNSRSDFMSEYTKFLSGNTKNFDTFHTRETSDDAKQIQISPPKIQKIEESPLHCSSQEHNTPSNVQQIEESSINYSIEGDCNHQNIKNIEEFPLNCSGINIPTQKVIAHNNVDLSYQESRSYTIKSELESECAEQLLEDPKEKIINKTLKVVVNRLPKNVVEKLIKQDEESSKQRVVSDCVQPSRATSSTENRVCYDIQKSLIKQSYVLLKRLPKENTTNKQNSELCENSAKDSKPQGPVSSENIPPTSASKQTLLKMSIDDNVAKNIRHKVKRFTLSLRRIPDPVQLSNTIVYDEDTALSVNPDCSSRLPQLDMNIDASRISEKEEESTNTSVSSNDTYLNGSLQNEDFSANSSLKAPKSLPRTSKVNKTRKGNRPRQKNNISLLVKKSRTNRGLSSVRKLHHPVRKETLLPDAKQKLLFNGKGMKTTRLLVEKPDLIKLLSTGISNGTKKINPRQTRINRKKGADYSSTVHRKLISGQKQRKLQEQTDKTTSKSDRGNKRTIRKNAISHLKDQQTYSSSVSENQQSNIGMPNQNLVSQNILSQPRKTNKSPISLKRNSLERHSFESGNTMIKQRYEGIIVVNEKEVQENKPHRYRKTCSKSSQSKNLIHSPLNKSQSSTALQNSHQPFHSNVMMPKAPTYRKTIKTNRNGQLIHPASEDGNRLHHLENFVEETEKKFDSYVIIDSNRAKYRPEYDGNLLRTTLQHQFEQNLPWSFTKPRKIKTVNLRKGSYHQPHTLAALSLQTFFGNKSVK